MIDAVLAAALLLPGLTLAKSPMPDAKGRVDARLGEPGAPPE